jgi:hypothetical protein
MQPLRIDSCVCVALRTLVSYRTISVSDPRPNPNPNTLVPLVDSSVPVYMSNASLRTLRCTAMALPEAHSFMPLGTMLDGWKQLGLGGGKGGGFGLAGVVGGGGKGGGDGRGEGGDGSGDGGGVGGGGLGLGWVYPGGCGGGDGSGTDGGEGGGLTPHGSCDVVPAASITCHADVVPEGDVGSKSL